MQQRIGFDCYIVPAKQKSTPPKRGASIPLFCYACISVPSRNVTVISLSLPTVTNSTMLPQRLPSNSLIVRQRQNLSGLRSGHGAFLFSCSETGVRDIEAQFVRIYKIPPIQRIPGRDWMIEHLKIIVKAAQNNPLWGIGAFEKFIPPPGLRGGMKKGKIKHERT